jgi:glycosyltransferase involved in cell wall biosynthesis
MKILLYSSVFLPSLGGIETITATLAENLTLLGHQCIVLTETAGDESFSFNYEVVRQPNWRRRLDLARECDIIHSNGASVAMYPYARLGGKPFVWTHNGYQVSCVDGLGWVDGEPTPMTPFKSLAYHFKKKGWLSGAKESVKLATRRYIANHVDLNIAATHWVAKRQPLKNQVVAYTPYPINRFKSANIITSGWIYDFIYVGRLVSEKGLPDLIKAFKLLVATEGFKDKKLAIVGSGNIKDQLEQMTGEIYLQNNIYFLGPKFGPELLQVISQAKIGVVPSAYEEPMGGVSLELLAAGKNIIISERGGHTECVGEAGLKFENGNAESLFKSMLELLTDDVLAEQQRYKAIDQLELFNELELTRKYLHIYTDVIKKYLG